jgi:hypothetical protein
LASSLELKSALACGGSAGEHSSGGGRRIASSGCDMNVEVEMKQLSDIK